MEELVVRLRDYVSRNYYYLVEEVRKLLKIPSVSGTGEGIKETAEFLRDWLRDRLGVNAGLLSYGGHPIVYGKLAGKSGKQVVIYNMYDVQPPDPLELWDVPPFEARVVGDRIVARGAYNTKTGLMCSLLGVEVLERVLREVPVSVVFVLEGEEEIGSPSLRRFFEDKRGELAGSYAAFFAYPSEDVPGRPTVELGNKGIVFVELRSSVSKYDVHSSLAPGLYNPAAVLAKIASELLDPLTGPRLSWLEEKVVTPTPEDLEYLSDLVESLPIERVIEEYGINRTRLVGRDWYIEVFFKPSVNIDGFYSGYVGPGTKTITPAEAVMRLDFRLVPNVEPEDVLEGLRKTIERLGLSELIEVYVHDCYTWSKTDPKHPAVRSALRAYSLLGLRPYVIPMSPGAAPSYLFTRILGVPMVSTGPGHGGRAHAPNEYVTLDTIPRLTLYVALLLAELTGA